jgi:hypothetical protein
MKQPPHLRLQGRASSSQRGGVLALSLIIVLTIAALSAGLLQLSSATTRRQAAATHRKLAFYMAEAGLAEGYVGLMIGKTGNVASEAAPAAYANGLFWVEATENTADRTVTLRSTGMVGNGRAVLSMVVEKGEPSVASLGVFSDGPLDLQPGSLIDGYDSEIGPYKQPFPATLNMPASKPTRLGRLASNQHVTVTGTAVQPTAVDGDVFPGPSSHVSLVGTTLVTGASTPSTCSVPLPPVDEPVVPFSSGVVHTSGVPLIVLPGESGMHYLTVSAGAQAILQGPSTVVFGKLVLEKGADLVLDNSGGTVNVFVRDRLELQSGATISTTGKDPSQAVFQVESTSGKPVELGARGSFHGVVYAPAADIVVHPDFELFGAVIGRGVRFTGPALLHFDRALEDLSVESRLPTLVSWRVVEISTPKDMGNTMDPFEYLGLDKTLLPAPAEAHADQVVSVDYLDKGGVMRTYEGMESTFDWDGVETVTELFRDGALVADVASTKEPAAYGLLSLVADPTIVSRNLKAALNDASPITDDVLAAAVSRSPRMDSADLRSVLETNAPLTEDVLSDVINYGPLAAADLRDVLIAHSPLPAGLFVALQNRVPALNAGALSAVMAAQ